MRRHVTSDVHTSEKLGIGKFIEVSESIYDLGFVSQVDDHIMDKYFDIVRGELRDPIYEDDDDIEKSEDSEEIEEEKDKDEEEEEKDRFDANVKINTSL